MKNVTYSPPECEFFEDSNYKSYWAFLFLLNCSDEQFNAFMDTPNADCYEEFIWAFNVVASL